MEIGHTYYHGNTSNAHRSQLLAIVTYSELPSEEQRTWTTLGVSDNGQVWVKLQAIGQEHLPRKPHTEYRRADIFAACYYRTHADMVTAYSARRAPSAGLPGAVLAGE